MDGPNYNMDQTYNNIPDPVSPIPSRYPHKPHVDQYGPIYRDKILQYSNSVAGETLEERIYDGQYLFCGLMKQMCFNWLLVFLHICFYVFL